MALVHNEPPSAGGEPGDLDELTGLVESIGQSALLVRARSAERFLLEVPFALPRTIEAADGSLPGVVEGVVDLAFREPDGWVVVDYKTDEVRDPAEMERRLAVYRSQVEVYAECWEALTGEPVKERILYLTAENRTESW
jgi:ATP-dependent helicase/nuclease subunit A